MTIEHSTCLWRVQEPNTSYKTINSPTTKQVTVQSTTYPPLKTNSGAGAWRKIPWINLRGLWLEEVGGEIETPYTIEVHDKKLIFTVV